MTHTKDKPIPTDERLLSLFNVPLTTKVEGSKRHYEKALRELCRELLCGYDLCIYTGDRSNIDKDTMTKGSVIDEKKTQRYSLLEVEVYFKTSAEYYHDDPYTHAHPLQYQNCVWYFHHVAHSQGYRGGTRKGLDVTLVGVDEQGEIVSSSGGGILIRAIQCMTTKKVIEGPSLLVDLILKQLGHNNIKELVSSDFDYGDSQPCWNSNSCFFLAPKQKDKPDEGNVHASCRIGLGLKNRSPSLEKRLDYVCRPYRYVTQPWLLHKGRIWDLLAILQHQQQQKVLHRKTSLTKAAAVSTLANTKGQIISDKQRKEYSYGRKNAVAVIKSCLQGSKDIVDGGSFWKLRVMSAILWREEQLAEGNRVDLGL